MNTLNSIDVLGTYFGPWYAKSWCNEYCVANRTRLLNEPRRTLKKNANNSQSTRDFVSWHGITADMHLRNTSGAADPIHAINERSARPRPVTHATP